MREMFTRVIRERNWSDKRMPCIARNICNRLGRRLPEGTEPALTEFQKTVIAHESFWRDWEEDAPTRNLMIQGATSAGKTLVSELAILDTIQHRKKAIVLVPLKAMVHERTRQFREDMGYGLPEYEDLGVFGSSSDYMENDEQIIAGSYDVAIIVYEKFFAMLSQGNTKVMEGCGLLIVDELSMLSQEQRGPKLEMALEIVKSRFPQTRIMCLVTCDCSTEKICAWLNIDEAIISTARPVALEEHILRFNGTGSWRYIPENHNALQAGNTLQEHEEEIPLSGYQPEARADEKIKKLLLAVLKKLYAETPDARVLVFTDARDKTAVLADFLKENAHVWRPDTKREVDEDLLAALSACDKDEGQAHLIDTLLPEGIAYHHAGLSSSLREIIEEQFQRPQSGLRVIVATETLTVGVNLPFDAMIMTTHLVNRGKGEQVSLTSQEYRNFIGRAGRLGQSNRVGKTYLFVRDSESFTRYWNSYERREEVKTALSKANEEQLAPYYLSLINGKVGSSGGSGSGTAYTRERLQLLFEQSLAKACGAKTVDTEKLQAELYNAYLSDKVIGNKPKGRGSINAGSVEYALEGFGAHMAPYAFSLDTCIRIYGIFFEGYNNGGLKTGLTRDEINADKYLLDILYHICCHQEITNSSSVPYPQTDRNTRNTYLAKDRVLRELSVILDEKDENGEPKYRLMWEEHGAEFREQSNLWLLRNRTNNTDESIMLQAALRAIVLFYWTQGYTVEELKKKTGFGEFVKLVAGDIERLAEMVAFQLDAIHKCLTTARDIAGDKPVYADEAAERAFYEMQTRVKYGMPRELAIFANKHIHGLDRKRLLRLKVAAEEAKLTPLQYLCITPPGKIPQNVLTTTQHTQLCFAMERRGKVKRIEMVMEIVQNDAGTELGINERKSLKALADWAENPESEEPFMRAKALYNNLRDLVEYAAFKNIRLSADGDARCIVWSLKDTDYEVHIGVVSGEETDDEVEQFLKRSADAKLLVVPATFTTEQMSNVMRKYNVQALINNIYLTFILGKTILMTVDQGTALTYMLGDLRGSFTMADYNYFPLRHFLPRKEQAEKGVCEFRILFGSGGECRESGNFNAEKLARDLSANGKLGTCEILPWGADIAGDKYNFAECPTILAVTRRDVTRSESLSRFIYKMRNQDFKNCILLLNSQEEADLWCDANKHEECGNNAWSTQYSRIVKSVVTDERGAKERIESFVNGWQRENFLVAISYAHYDTVAEEDKDECFRANALLKQLAQRLSDRFGEFRIFFDQFPTAASVFKENKNRERSLEAYRDCVAGVILWNYWTRENANCRRECEILFEEGEKDGIYCMLLQTDDSRQIPPAPSGYYPQNLTADNIDELAETIIKEVEKRI